MPKPTLDKIHDEIEGLDAQKIPTRNEIIAKITEFKEQQKDHKNEIKNFIKGRDIKEEDKQKILDDLISYDEF